MLRMKILAWLLEMISLTPVNQVTPWKVKGDGDSVEDDGHDCSAHRYLVEDVDDFSDPDSSVLPCDVLPTAESTLLDIPAVVESEVSAGSEDFLDALDEVASLNGEIVEDSLYVTSPHSVTGTDPALLLEAESEQCESLAPPVDEPPGSSDVVASQDSSFVAGRSEQDSSCSDDELDDLPTPTVNRRERTRFSERRNIQPPRKFTYGRRGHPSFYR